MIHLILSSPINDPPGGISQFCLYLCEYFKKNNLDYKIYYIGSTPVEKHEDHSCFFNVKKSPKMVFFLGKMILDTLKGRINFDRDDTIIVNRVEVAAALFPLVRCKKIQFIHGSSAYANIFWSNWVLPVYFLAERISISLSTATVILLANKAYGLPYYKALYRKSKDKLLYSNLPISSSFAKSLGCWENRQAEKIVIGYHGRLEDNPKRILDYLDVLYCLIHRGVNAQLCLVGEGGDMQALKDKAAQLHIEDKVLYAGSLAGDKLVDMVKTFDVFLLLSKFEGICLSTLEASALGLPIVSTMVGDIDQYVKEGEHGFFVRIDYNIDEVATAVVRASKLERKDNPYLEHYSISSFERNIADILDVY